MKHIHIAALEPDADLAKKIGKKGSESDFCIYNCKESGSVVCLYHPMKYPERVQPLLYCLSLADAAYFHPTAIDKFAGEMIVAAAVFMVACDIISRLILPPLEIPIGVITAIIGAPIFIFLLKTKQKV